MHINLFPKYLLAFRDGLVGLVVSKGPRITETTTASSMSRHQLDLVVCSRLPGTRVGVLCSKCDGRCPTCDSYVNPQHVVRVCDDCSFGSLADTCIICGNAAKPGEAMHDAYYCTQCCLLERDRDGCPRVLNVGVSRSDNFYQQKKKGISN